MPNPYHLLNGDSLKEKFPPSIQGELIVIRECLVDGSVEGGNLTELFQTRAQFISQHYEGYDEKDYYQKTVTEFQKIQDIPDDAVINLWFEDDLFCQVNFWFTLHLLNQTPKNHPVFLIRPLKHSPYSFGGLDQSELIAIYKNRILLAERDKLATFWEAYQKEDIEKLLQLANTLEPKYPFLLPAVQAHIDRIPTEEKPGKPIQAILEIMEELNTEKFEPVFKAFNQREKIYGFGDLQVKRLWEEIKNKG